MTVPIWFLVLPLQAAGVVLALAISALFGPMINAPLIGVITMRTPEALRPKVMTAIITLAMLAGPVGLLVAGPLLEAVGPHSVFLLVAAGETLAVIPFAVFAFRRSAGAATSRLREAARLDRGRHDVGEHVSPEVRRAAG